jgi:hypothetical protein
MIGWLYFRISSTAAKNVAGISFSGCFLQKPEKFTPDSSYNFSGRAVDFDSDGRFSWGFLSLRV